jgi:Amt family ammonium transporter
VGGALGTILLGVFATKAWNAGGADGLITGDVTFLGKQILAVAVTIAFSVAGTLVILKVVDATVGLRVTADEEREGLDINLHGEEGYSIGSSTYGRADMAVAPAAAHPASKTSPTVVS